MLQWKIFRYKAVAIGWLLLMSILFVLPGSALPQQKWLIEVPVDKLVHVFLFAVFFFLWRSAFDRKENYYTLYLFLLTLLYGLFIEIVQGQWVSNRSFDVYDLLSDGAGSLLGLWVWAQKG